MLPLNKLVRDRISDLIRSKGSSVPSIKILHNDAEFLEYLKKKIVEEANEVAETTDDEHLIEELADVYEVIDAICAHQQIPKEKVINKQKSKRKERGGFEKRIAFVDSPPNT